MKALADYIHGKGLKFGMYSCAGTKTCAGYPGSYGHEAEDAKQFAQWDVDYLKYDFCYFPVCADAKNAYLTMAMALRSSGKDILFAACNWGKYDPSGWMRSRGAHTYRSTGDIFDVPKSYKDIFKSQVENIEGNAPDCYNDMDMLITGMHGSGNVGLNGCTDQQYLQHFAMWSFLGSPLIDPPASVINIDIQVYTSRFLFRLRSAQRRAPAANPVKSPPTWAALSILCAVNPLYRDNTIMRSTRLGVTSGIACLSSKIDLSRNDFIIILLYLIKISSASTKRYINMNCKAWSIGRNFFGTIG